MGAGRIFGKSVVKAVGIAIVTAVFCVGCGGGGNSGAGDYKLKVSVKPADGGVVEIDPLSNSYPEWAKVEVAAKANKGFFFEGWSGEDASASRKVTITMSGKKNKALTANFTNKPPTLGDKRDGKSYRIAAIGEQVWMAENLNYEAEGSKCYENSADNCAKYGRLYNWVAAKSACPAGWHLPSDDEWTELEEEVGGRSTAGTKLKSTSGWNNNGNGTDEYAFSALPGGNGNSDGDFGYVGDNGYWWSATEYDASRAWYRYMHFSSEDVSRNINYKSLLFSVRCLQD